MRDLSSSADRGAAARVGTLQTRHGAPDQPELAQIRHLPAGFHDLVQQIQAVAAHDLVVGIDLHGLEKRVDGRAKGGHVRHRGTEIFGLQRRSDRGGGGVERGLNSARSSSVSANFGSAPKRYSTPSFSSAWVRMFAARR
jgi:hypothetical protein